MPPFSQPHIFVLERLAVSKSKGNVSVTLGPCVAARGLRSVRVNQRPVIDQIIYQGTMADEEVPNEEMAEEVEEEEVAEMNVLDALKEVRS